MYFDLVVQEGETMISVITLLLIAFFIGVVCGVMAAACMWGKI
jgi:uncharacterized membrane protein YciS (DUF1049 family)